jgi:carboxyl-terminal processing protease
VSKRVSLPLWGISLLLCAVLAAGALGTYALLVWRAPQVPFGQSGVLLASPGGMRLLTAIDEMQKYALYPLEPERAFEVALEGVAQTLAKERDRYAGLLRPREYADAIERFGRGRIFGIGVYLAVRDGLPQISSVIPGTPAEKAGLLAGDLIVAVDGRPTEGLDTDVVSQWVRGAEGTQVTLSLRRAGGADVEVTLTREAIQIAPVTSRILEGDIGYVRLVAWATQTGKETLEQIERLKASGARGLVIDLRSNGGGDSNAVIDLLHALLPEGTGLFWRGVNEKLGPGFSRDLRPWKVPGPGVGLPVILLVNRETASASEIFAAGMQGSGAAQVVGVRTYAKGTAQRFLNLGENWALRVSAAEYFDAHGRPVEQRGIEPDVVVEQERPGRADPPLDTGNPDDPRNGQLREAVRLLRERIGPRSS